MSGLISRLKEIIEKYNAGCYNETCNPFASCTDCVLKQIREVIESQPPADLPWIPVSSGILPETGQQIFATCEQEGETDVMEIYYNSELLVPPWRMTAWMPAEPYKGVE